MIEEKEDSIVQTCNIINSEMNEITTQYNENNDNVDNDNNDYGIKEGGNREENDIVKERREEKEPSNQKREREEVKEEGEEEGEYMIVKYFLPKTIREEGKIIPIQSKFKFNRTIFYSEDARVFVFQVDKSSSFIKWRGEEGEGEGDGSSTDKKEEENTSLEEKWNQLKWEWVVFKEIVGETNQNFHYEMSIFEELRGGKHIIPIIGWFPNGDINHVMIMPFIEDQSPINEKEIKHYMKEALESLSFLHSFGIMHRNLKRKNTLYCKHSRQFYLIDFGDATHWENGRWYHEAGNSKYLAPEQYGGRNYNPLVDIFSLGIIFAELIFGVKHVIRHENREDFIKGLAEWQLRPERDHSGSDNWWVNWLMNRENERTDKKGNVYRVKTCFLKETVQHLLDRLTCANPNHRITAQEALKHQYFNED